MALKALSSAAAADPAAEEGALWAATDEAILANSLTDGLRDRRQLYQPYHYQDLPLLFRDRELSDRIGFVYGRWQPLSRRRPAGAPADHCASGSRQCKQP
ncbi:MAG: hypothetical protein R2864_07410 [Syntrophotaleaceae bacterium]